MFSSCLLWSSLSPVREKGERGTSCEGQLGLMDTLLRLYRAETTGLKTVIPSLTLVIMGALLDLRRAPPPAPPAAPAHWSTSIRSIPWSTGPAVAAPTAGLRPFEGGVGLYSSPVEARPAGLTTSKPRAAESAG